MPAATEPLLSSDVTPFGAVVLSGPLRVPLNQRPWEWDVQNLDDLFEDLVDTTDRWYEPGADGRWQKRSSVNLLPHFFGPLVLEEDESEPRRAIVDGQQRLIAATILIALMRDHAQALEAGPAATRPSARALQTALSSWLLADPDSGDHTPRLQLDDTVNDFFEGYVVQASGDEERASYLVAHPADPVGDSEDVRRALIDALRHLSERLTAQLAERHPDGNSAALISRLQSLFGTLKEAFLVIVVRVLTPGMVPQVFSGLNARGAELNQADKIKNELFLVGPPEDHLAIKSAWDTMVRLAPERDAQSLLRFRYIAFRDDTRQADLYRNVRAKELDHGGTLSVVRRWAEDARLMRIVAGQEEHPNVSETARRYLLDIRLVRHSYVRPLLLAAAHAYLAESPDLFTEAVLLARNVAFRELLMQRSRPETFLSRIGPISRALAAGLDMDGLRAQLLEISPDEDFEENFTTYYASRTSVQYYILYELEMVTGGTSGLVPAPHSPDPQDYLNNIEHVLPMRPSRTRITEFAEWRDPEDPSRKNLALHRRYIHRIGNLLLIDASINSVQGDFSFHAKQTGDYPTEFALVRTTGEQRACYRDSTLRLPQELADAAEWATWAPEDIDRRQSQLAERAVIAWRLRPPPRQRRARRTPARRA